MYQTNIQVFLEELMAWLTLTLLILNGGELGLQFGHVGSAAGLTSFLFYTSESEF